MIVPMIDVTERMIRVMMASLTDIKKFHTRSIGGRVRFSSAMRGHLQLSGMYTVYQTRVRRANGKRDRPERGRGGFLPALFQRTLTCGPPTSCGSRHT